MKKCNVDGCNYPVDAKGFCSTHYTRFTKHGHPLGGPPMKARAGEIDEFLRKALCYSGNECLLWPFGKNGAGYPKIGRGGTTVLAHRIICEETNGPPPCASDEAAHECGNGHIGCVAPAHLKWKSRKGNAEDMVLHGRSQRGSKQHMSILNEEIVKSIRSSKQSNRTLARMYGVNPSTISFARNGRTWKHVQ